MQALLESRHCIPSTRFNSRDTGAGLAMLSRVGSDSETEFSGPGNLNSGPGTLKTAELRARESSTVGPLKGILSRCSKLRLRLGGRGGGGGG